MPLKFGGKAVMRIGQRLTFGTKPNKQQNKKEDNKVKHQSISQHDQGRWSRLITLVQTFFSEQVAMSGRDDFVLSGTPTTELNIDSQERDLLTALFKVTVLHFQTGRDISSVKEFQLPTSTNAADKQFAEETLARWKYEAKRFASEQPDAPPALLLAKTEAQKRIDAHYADEKNVITNESGQEAFVPPPCLLAPLTEEEREATR